MMCIKCNQDKESEFFRSGKNICKKCEYEYCKQWKKNNKDKVSAYAKAAYDKDRYTNDEEFRNRRLESSRKSYRNNYVKKLISGAKLRSQKLGLPFDIEESDIVIPEFCPVFGFKLEVSSGRPSDNSPSIDKIIPELGYTKGNVRVISYLANRMKSNATPEQLITFAEWVLNEKFTQENR